MKIHLHDRDIYLGYINILLSGKAFGVLSGKASGHVPFVVKFIDKFQASVCLSDTMINVLIATNMRSVGIARDWRHGSWYPNATPIYGVVSLPYRHP